MLRNGRIGAADHTVGRPVGRADQRGAPPREAQTEEGGGQPAQQQRDDDDVPQRAAGGEPRPVEAVQAVEEPAVGAGTACQALGQLAGPRVEMEPGRVGIIETDAPRGQRTRVLSGAA